MKQYIDSTNRLTADRISNNRFLDSVYLVSAAAAAFLLTLLILVLFEPRLPQAGLDSSWAYGLAFAAAHGLQFGPDIIFTSGPLGSLYTSLRLPNLDAAYIVLQAAITTLLFFTLLVNTSSRNRFTIVLIPIMISLYSLTDALFIFIPLAFYFACNDILWFRRSHVAFVIVASVLIGIIPLVKTSFVLSVAVCTLASCHVLWRKIRLRILIIPALMVASTLVMWMIAGQSLRNLPIYVVEQMQIVSGYTDSMSVVGPTRQILLYWIGAAVLCLLSTLFVPSNRLVTAAVVLLVEFVAFKAGYVRQDGHVFIAVSTLGLLGFLLFLRSPGMAGCLAFATGMLTWIAVTGSLCLGEDQCSSGTFTRKVLASYHAIGTRLAHPDQVFAPFMAAKQDIKTGAALPRLDGTVDIYPTEISAVIGSDLQWDPRPVIQSYSAYTPGLAAINADHLRSPNGPKNLLFSVAPIDNRLPALEDGRSWPEILSKYEFSSFLPDYALWKRNGDHPVTIAAPVLSGRYKFGQMISVPTGTHYVWASIKMRPSLKGRMASALFKLPVLQITLELASGEQRSFRFIAGPADGFMLSPLVLTAKDFVAVSTADEGLLTDKDVHAFRIDTESPSGLWGEDFEVGLSPISIEPHHESESAVVGSFAEGPNLAQASRGGDCAVDFVGGMKPKGPLPLKGKAVEVRGWAVYSSKLKQAPADVKVALVEPSGRTFYSQADKVMRPDVNQYLNLNSKDQVGFESTVDLRGAHGTYDLFIVQYAPSGMQVCPLDPIKLSH